MDHNPPAFLVGPERAMPLIPDDGLAALTRFARTASGADFAVVFKADEDGLAVPLAVDPGPLPQPFSLTTTRLELIDWSHGQVDTASLRLPTTVLVSLGRPTRQALLIPTPTDTGPRSGILLLWAANAAPQCVCPHRNQIAQEVPLLARVFSQMLADRHAELQRNRMSERFHDLLESLTTGVIVVESDSSRAILNEPAAALLGLKAGEVETPALGSRMKYLREQCVNAVALDEAYGVLQGTLDYEAKTIWILEDRQLEVDTHPILGNGRNGRIWLFQDVTARHQLEEQLRSQAQSDPLTGLLNRRGLIAASQEMFTTAAKGGQTLAALMIDIDYFKRINDTYGHPAGDEVLKAVAKRLRSELDGQGLCARIGGEEFAVLALSHSLDAVAQIAERLRTAVGATPVQVDAVRISVSASIGVAPQLSAESNIKVLLTQADRVLYQAKNEGRNRVVIQTSL